MKSFTCAAIQDGAVFRVTLEDGQQVFDLKDAIKEKWGCAYPPHELSLYLAKQDTSWIKATNPEVIMLWSGKVGAQVKALLENKAMHPRMKLGTFDLPSNDSDDIHVLVAVRRRWLTCAMVGVGTIIYIDILDYKTVIDLQKAIRESPNFAFRAACMDLYVAKKGSKWLTINDLKEVKSSGMATLTTLGGQLMKPRTALGTYNFLGEVAYYEEDGDVDDVHVLVVSVPPAREVASSVTISCVAIGVGTLFTLKVRDSVSVLGLKNAIHTRYQFPVYDLDLYLAQRSDGTWIKEDDPDGMVLKSGHLSGEIKPLMTPATMMDDATQVRALNLPDDDSNDIHVLVAVRKRLLTCAVVGVGTIIHIDMRDHKTVLDLQKAISESPNFAFRAECMDLYVAKKDNTWLTIHDADVKLVKTGKIRCGIKAITTAGGQLMAPHSPLHSFNFPGEVVYVAGGDIDAIHLLVTVPKSHQKASNVAISCVVVGSGVSVAIVKDERDTVLDLKKAITERMEFPFPAFQLTLYVTKTNNSDWLQWSDRDAIELTCGEIPRGIKQLMSDVAKMDSESILSAFHFVDDEVPIGDDIHVLVDLPAHAKSGVHYDSMYYYDS
ncbi:hypothetical protein DYB25_009757 [Aphanomyces astaci]|uniref:Crinkler effector protein N-terminal domain-containing protein n=3 Tax=Aphanomyces astaci TaxID=112090 RepID=A0A397ALY1_APHAT|nr:hypothetical protein DYB25_009757 [Aphanomyces astaci]